MSTIEQLNQIPVLLYIISLMLGLLVGSFLNVVIFRVPKILERELKEYCDECFNTGLISANDKTKFNLWLPHSHCPGCKQIIKPWHNIPILSYLLLHGKCAKCKASISLRYPCIELITGLLTVLSIYSFGLNWQGVSVVLFCWMLLSLTMIDWDTQLLPDNITYPFLWTGIIFNIFQTHTDIYSSLWGAISGYLILWSVYWLFKLLRNKEGMGYGDFKLLAGLGAWLGWQFLPLIILLSSFVGTIIGGGLMLIQKKDQDTPIPFGPYLAGAGFIAMFWGEQLINYYFQFFNPG